jgi:hypothetical protein
MANALRTVDNALFVTSTAQNSVTEFTQYKINLTKNLVAQSFSDTGFFTYIDNIAAQAGSGLIPTNFVSVPSNQPNFALTAADTGKVFFLPNPTIGTQIDLPVPSAALVGTKYTFILSGQNTSGLTWLIRALAPGRMFGNCFAAISGPGLNINASHITIFFTATLATSTVGDRLEFLCIGNSWNVIGYSRVPAAFAVI